MGSIQLNPKIKLPLKVMFVDDDKLILDGLRRQFRSKRDVWIMRFANNAQDAIELLEEEPADIVISDMRMPGMNGAELLSHIQQRWPQTVRFILSGQTDQADLLSNIGAIHQFLQKPCEQIHLESAIDRTLMLNANVESRRAKDLVSSVSSMPIISDTYTNLCELLEADEVNAEIVARVVSQDVSLTVKILQLVNSAFFGMPRSISSIKEAVVIIGFKPLLEIIITANIFHALDSGDITGCTVNAIWTKSMSIGSQARALAKQCNQSRDIQELANLSGMFSHLGRAIVAWENPADFHAVHDIVAEGETDYKTEELTRFGASQETIGAYALGIWGFSEKIIHAIAYQDNPAESGIETADSPLPWLHLARAIAVPSKYTQQITPDYEWLESIGISRDIISEARIAA